MINRSAPILSVSDNPASTTMTNDLGDTSWADAFTSTTNLQLTRTGNLVTQPTVAWFGVQFTNVVNLIDRREIYP
ncbi:MAG TPA: hypothetical protein VHE58_01425 [Burkholderiales bacterium]|nr:hypothetical protein [Burkholderiales bacterium]